MIINTIYNKTILDLDKSKLTIENVFAIGYLAACKDHINNNINNNHYNVYKSLLTLDNQPQIRQQLIRDFDINNYPKSEPIIYKKKKYSYTISDINDIHKIRKYRENTKLKYSKKTIENYKNTIYCVDKMNYILNNLKIGYKN